MAKKLAFDKVLFTCVLLLLVTGLIMVFSATVVELKRTEAPVLDLTLFSKQLVAAAIGLLAMVSLMHVDYRLLARPWVLYPSLLGVLVLLVVVLHAPTLNQTRRWLFFGGFSLQPSELAKFALVVFLAQQIDRRQEEALRGGILLPPALFVAMLTLLIILEPDFGTAGLLVIIASAMFFLAGLSWRYVALAAVGGVTVFLAVVATVPYVRDRILAFSKPELDPLGAGFQILQSLIAVGSGGFSGLGLGQSVQKLHFLPLANSDFIFAIMAEELGLLGAGALVALYAVFCWRGLLAGRKAPDVFGRFLAYGLTGALCLQALLNIGMTLQLVPISGFPLPLISAGGSSLVMSLGACGVLLNISQHV